jgi:hypothetical protein
MAPIHPDSFTVLVRCSVSIHLKRSCTPARAGFVITLSGDSDPTTSPSTSTPRPNPDIVHDLREGIPAPPIADGAFWPAILIDRPYTEDDADHYATGRATLPNLNTLLKDALLWVPLGHRVGVLDYLWPHPGKTGTEVAVISVYTGRNNRVRTFTVFGRIAAK